MAFISEEERRRALALMSQRQGLGGVFMRPPPPVQATPSTPLPAAPLDRPVVAPQAQQYNEFSPVRALMERAPQQFAPTGVKKIDDELMRRSSAQQAGAENFMNIIEGAQADPRVMAILQARRERAQKEQADLEKDQKRSGWDALARAGIAMAKSNSPYFMQALASGMEAGLEGLDAAKLKRDEKRSRLQAAEEDTVLAEIKSRQEAQDRSLGIYNAMIAAGKTEGEARDAAIKGAVTAATLPQQLELADLEVAGKRADIALTEARRIDALRPPSSGGGGDGTGGPRPLPPGAKAEAEGRLATAYSEQDEAYRNWVRKGKPILGKVKEGSAEWEVASKYEAARGKVNNILGTLGRRTLGVAPVRVGGQRVTQAQRDRTPNARPVAASTRPAGVGADWTYEVDSKGNKAWVSPDRKRFKEVR